MHILKEAYAIRPEDCTELTDTDKAEIEKMNYFVSAMRKQKKFPSYRAMRKK